MAQVSRNPRPLFVTALPTTPSDGMEVYYQSTTAGTGGGSSNSMADVGAVWHLRYRAAASGSYKWEFLGGAPTSHQNAGGATTCTTGLTNYTPSSWTSPSVKVPLVGTYIYSLIVNLTQQSSSASTLTYQNLVASTTGTLFSQQQAVVPVNIFGSYYIGGLCGQDSSGNLAAGETLSYGQGSFAAANTVTINFCRIELTPMRVG